MADGYTLDKAIDLNTNLDDIPELPGYVQLFSGAYHVTMDKGIEEKEINDQSYFSAEMTVKDVMELSEEPAPGESIPKAGDIQSFLFRRDHAVAMNNFKQFLAQPIAAKFGCKTVGDVIENSRGLEMIIIGKRTYNKEKDQHNFNIKKSSVV